MLNQDKKNALIELEKSYWWQVLQEMANERIDEINRNTLWVEWFNPDDNDTKIKLKDSNLKILAIKEFISLVNNNTLWIARPKV